MGRRISYYLSNDGSTFKELIHNQYQDFRQWFLKMHAGSIEEFNEELGSEQLIQLLKAYKKFPEAENIDQKILDEVVCEFIGTHCDYGNGRKLLTIFGPCMSKWRYTESTALINEKMDHEAKRIWNYLIFGRSLFNDNHFIADADEYKIGFWSLSERKYLKNSIETAFGSLEEIRNKYWTHKEKSDYKKALDQAKIKKLDTFGLSDHHPDTSGIEYVLQVLNETSDKKADIIIGIE